MPTKFVILGTQRTGTTWIRTTLDSHPAILALGEVFLYRHGRLPFRRPAGLDVQQSYRTFIQGSPRRRLMHFFNRSRNVTDYLRQLYARPGFEAIGFKLMRTHCREFPSVVDYLLRENVAAIHVVRQNVLKTLISRKTARQRKLHHARSSVQVAKITLDVESLLPALDRIAADNEEWAKLFRNSPYLEVPYEAFVTERGPQLRRIYDFLGVEPAGDVSSSLVKINPDSLRDVLANYDEVAAALQETRFASCLGQK